MLVDATMRVFLYGFAILVVGQLAAAINHGVARENWDAYCSKFSSVYAECSQTASSSIAQMYYNYNLHLLEKLQTRHTNLNYTVAENQFTAMRYKQYKAMFPLTARAAAVGDPAVVGGVATAPEFALSVTPMIFDQGIKCNSGWAYATANAISYFLPAANGAQPLVPYSAQRLIDCVGGKTCKNESPMDAFLYLMQNQPLPSEALHLNTPEKAAPGSCMQLPDLTTLTEYTDYVTLTDYVSIPDPTEAEIKNAISSGYAVVVEVDPTSFEFMHYATGVFQQPANKKEKGSHFMTAIGFDTDVATQLPYWDLVNSFGTTWGESGKMRLDRATKIRSAYIPIL